LPARIRENPEKQQDGGNSPVPVVVAGGGLHDLAWLLLCTVQATGSKTEGTAMNTRNHSIEGQRGKQVFRFLIKGNSVTRATVTILAEDSDVAWNRLHALFPGSDHSETEMQYQHWH
jgi:hypothetical protein